MYVLYEKATNRVVQVSISSVKEPTWADVVEGLPNAYLYAGFSMADDPEVLRNMYRYEVCTRADGTKYLERHKRLTLEYEGGWTVVSGWQRLVCKDEPVFLRVRFVDEDGVTAAVSGTLRVDAVNVDVSDAYVEVDNQDHVDLYITGRSMCHTSVDMHFYPTSHPFHRPDRADNEGRPCIKEQFQINVVSLGTFKKHANRPYLDVVPVSPSISADGVSTTVCHVYKRLPNGTIDNGASDTVDITTSRGYLLQESTQLVNGRGSFVLRSIAETVTTQLVVRSTDSNVIRGEGAVRFCP